MSDMDYRMDGMPEEMEKTEEMPDLLQIYLDEVQAVRELLPEEEAAAVAAAAPSLKGIRIIAFFCRPVSRREGLAS